MKGGRLKVVNESRYPDEEVSALVRFGLDEIDLTGDGIVAVVRNTARGYSGVAYSLAANGIPSTLCDKYLGKRDAHLIVLRIGQPDAFPCENHRRYAGVPKITRLDWREGLVAIAAHEGMHSQHAYDGAYTRRSVVIRHHRDFGPIRQRRRIGTQRIEPKCEAFEAHMLRRYRAECWKSPAAFATVGGACEIDQGGGAVD